MYFKNAYFILPNFELPKINMGLRYLFGEAAEATKRIAGTLCPLPYYFATFALKERARR
jgi:hypothetical protein